MYATGLQTELGLSISQAQYLTLLVIQLPTVVLVALSALSVDHCGRRALLLTGVAMGIAATSLFSLKSYFPTFLNPIVTLGALLLSKNSVYVGFITVMGAYSAELVPQQIRSLIATLSQRFVT